MVRPLLRGDHTSQSNGVAFGAEHCVTMMLQQTTASVFGEFSTTKSLLEAGNLNVSSGTVWCAKAPASRTHSKRFATKHATEQVRATVWSASGLPALSLS